MCLLERQASEPALCVAQPSLGWKACSKPGESTEGLKWGGVDGEKQTEGDWLNDGMKRPQLQQQLGSS